MIRKALIALGTAARALVRNWRACLLFNLLYAALLAVLYLFVATKEARLWQLLLTAFLALTAPILFFILQAAGVRYAQGEAQPARLLRSAVKDFWILLVVSLPLILLAALVIYLLNELQAYFSVDAPSEAARPPALRPSYPPAAPPPAPMRWRDVIFSALRLLLLGVALPLAAIHLWIAIAREGFVSTLKKSWRIPALAFAPTSVLVYTIGLIGFGLMPYFLIFTRTPVSNAWAELILFGMRLALAFIFTLWGWIITLGALAKTTVEVE